MQQSGLRLDIESAALQGGYSGPVIVAGKSAESKLIRMVADGKMPPGPKKLTPAEAAELRQWIDAGPKWPAAPAGAAQQRRKTDHWSFQPIRKPAIPAVKNSKWVRNPIDAFVLARLEKEGIAPSPEAPAGTLARRVALDLTGLPPDAMPGESHDQSANRLLRSQHYGEKWGRHWLDQARYADTDGYETDRTRPYAWRYRQWVIEAVNRDMPFDRFTIEQLAGDLLPNPSVDQRVATGFHRNAIWNREGGVDTEEFRVEATLDRTNTTGTVWLGLSVGCAQCHDHKYDPFSQRDYYQFFGFFNQIWEQDIDAPVQGELGAWMRGRKMFEEESDALLARSCLPPLLDRWEKILLDIQDKPSKDERYWRAWKNLGNISIGGQGILRLPREKRTREQQETLIDYFLDRATDAFSKKELDAAGLDDFRRQWRELKAKSAVSRAQAISEIHTPRKTNILLRGNFRNPGVEVMADVPSALPALPAGGKPDRLALANWLVSRDNPLTARVIVNRVWQEYFGRGIVRTSEDFGKQGERPSHPELLDWLASEFMDRGWSMRELHRLIVTSATYRQSSNTRPELRERDPDNVLLARQRRLRLSAELVRDTALSASGLLNPAVGGKSVKPPQPKGVAELTYANNAKWIESEGADRYRRGMYIFFQRTSPYPQLMNFDAPDAILACSRRQRSNTPLQALNTLNDPVFLESAQALALRVLNEAPAGFRERLTHGYRLAVHRDPRDKEVETMARHFERAVRSLESDSNQAKALFPLGAQVSSAEAAGWTVVSRVILNLDEFLHRE